METFSSAGNGKYRLVDENGNSREIYCFMFNHSFLSWKRLGSRHEDQPRRGKFGNVPLAKRNSKVDVISSKTLSFKY